MTLRRLLVKYNNHRKVGSDYADLFYFLTPAVPEITDAPRFLLLVDNNVMLMQRSLFYH